MSNGVAVKEKRMPVRDKRLHIYDFRMSAKFVDPDYPADITEDMRAMLKDIHPSMVIGAATLVMKVYKVSYSYSTRRVPYKQGYKMLFLKEGDSVNYLDKSERDIMIENVFANHISEFNFKYPYKAISNVKIHEVVPYANAEISVG